MPIHIPKSVLPMCLIRCYGLYVPGLQKDGKTKIRVEPGLFEWTKWVSGTSLPAWIPTADLAAANLSVDTTYRYFIRHSMYYPSFFATLFD